MLRPKRVASQKPKQKHTDETESEDDDGDFSSASSDEYNPNSSKVDETFDSEDEEEEEEEEEESESSPEKTIRDSKKSHGNRSIIATLRGSVSNKFKRRQSGSNLQDILQRAQYKKKRSIFDDSGDDTDAPKFDCSGGLRLSDSDSNDEEDISAGIESQRKTSTLVNSINQSSSTTMVDLVKLHDNYQKMEKDKAQLSKYKNPIGSSQKENINIADLLAIGEGSSSKEKKSRKLPKEDSDDDGWEEVEDDDSAYKIPKQVEIILKNGENNNIKKQEKSTDFEAQLKRKLNRTRKEHQLRLHKVNLMAWISHCNFVNRKINNSDLMAEALKLLPKNNNHCYPNEKTDVDYFKQVTNWFRSTIKLNNKDMYCKLKKRPPLMMSLALQMKIKTAICRRDYVLIFIILLRALGIQCRMVHSLNCAPIMPPKSDLISLAKKPEQKSSQKKSSKSSKKKQVKIPQLDGAEDDMPQKKSMKSSKTGEEPKGSKSISTTKMAAKVKVPLGSPNRNRNKSPSDNLFKSKKTEKSNSKTISPRKTRSKDQKVENRAQKSEKLNENGESSKSKETKDTLQVFSPRRLRSRSRSNEAVVPTKTPDKKPNLKNLKRASNSKTEDVTEPKKSKSSGTKRKREIAKPDSSKKPKILPDSDDSSKCFKTSSKKASTSTIDRRVLSSDDDSDTATASAYKSPLKSKRIDIWVEVYSEKDDKWISIDILKNKVDCISDITKEATHPIVYVFAFNNDNSLKDVSARYCPNLNTTVRKLRVDQPFLQTITKQFEGIKTLRDVKEDDELNKLQLKIPMPTSIALFKNHPLYALKRHLLKYEALYPVEPPILGYIRDEAIYPRDCVFILHTRETWLKEARVVKLNEVPYKITKTLKWDNTTKKLLKDVPQELFGIWQTKEYEPPVAENGIVPRNAYGNVELFKPQMLPKGCVHLNLPGLNKVCKKIGVDCSQAITGFDSNGGWPFPVYTGFVICEEFQEKVIDAWNREQEEIERKEAEKYEKRVYGNWKKLIKGLLIRERLKRKYNFANENGSN